MATDADFKARFVREAEAAAKLDHPNVVTIHEVSDYQGRPFFAMQLVDGPSLRDLIKAKKLTLDGIINLATQICEGLQEAHEADIVHRDIKPSNIILDKKGRPKILDFGLAAVRGTDKLTKTGSTLGTVGYMSPEQAEGKEVDQRSDLFSFGVVLYEMITGKRPFDRESDVATSKAIVTDTAEPLVRYQSGVPSELQRVVTKLLEKDPALRYQSAAGVVSDLKPLGLSGSRPVSLVTQSNRVKILTWVGAISVVVIVAIWGWPAVQRLAGTCRDACEVSGSCGF